MKLALFIVTLGLVALSPLANGFVLPDEVTSDNLNNGSLAFDIQSKWLPNGDVEFTVKISERTLKIPDHYVMGLGYVKITDNPNAKAGEAVHTEEGHSVRSLKSDRHGHSVLCVFIVTKEELKIADLSFDISWYAGESSAYAFFAKVKNFMPK